MLQRNGYVEAQIPTKYDVVSDKWWFLIITRKVDLYLDFADSELFAVSDPQGMELLFKENH